jgi:hypothetical protein
MPDAPKIVFNPKTREYRAFVNGQWAPIHVVMNPATGEHRAWIGGNWVSVGHLNVPAQAPATGQPAKSQPGWGEWAARMALKYGVPGALTYRGALTGAEFGSRLGLEVGGPWGAVIGGALGGIGGAGLASGANEYLPQLLGGAKHPSFGRGFFYGAIPEALLGAASLVLRPAVKTAEAAAGAQEKAIGEAVERAARVKQSLRSWVEKQIAASDAIRRLRSLMPEPPETIDTSGRAAEDLVQVGREAAQRVRAGIGRAIGRLYETLKLPEDARIKADDLENLGMSVEGIQSKLNAPISPQTQRLLQRVANLGIVREAEEDAASPSLLDAFGRPIPQAEIKLPRKEIPATSLLRLRQEISKALEKARGADRYALGSALEEIDNVLYSFLPPEIHPLRAQYRGIMRVLPYDVERDLGQAIRPREAAEVLFENPERALAIIRQVKDPADLQVLRDGFAQKVMSGIDPSKPIGTQVFNLRKALQPWLAKDVTGRSVVEELYGPNAEQEIRNLMNAPMNAVRLSALFANPESRQAALDEMKRTIMNDPQRAKLAAAVKRAVARLQAMKSPQEAAADAIRQRLEGGARGDLGYAGHRLGIDALIGLGQIGAGYEFNYPILKAAGITYLVWRTAINLGAAGPLARFLASSTARQAGRNLARLLVAIGSQATRQSMEDTSEEPVEMPAPAAAAGAP